MSVGFNLFVQAFEDYNRSNNFSRSALGHLFEYLEELETDTGEEIELDVIALCCEYSEYSSAEDIIAAFDHNQEFADADPEDLEALHELLSECTSVVCCEEDCIVIQDF